MKLKLIVLIGLFIVLNLNLWAETLTDGKGLFKSNKLIEHLLFKDSNIQIHQIKIEKLHNVSIEILVDRDADATFFKWKNTIIPFAGEIVISDILSNKKNDNLYIFSQSINSDLSYYDVTRMNNIGLKVLGSYEAPNIYGDTNFQKLEEIHKGVDYIFKARDADKYLYSNLDKSFIINNKNKEGVSLAKIKQYFEKYKKTINAWKGFYLDKRENWMNGEVNNIHNTFIFFENKECEIILNNKNRLKCTIIKNVSKEDMPIDEKLKKKFQNMDSILVTHRESNNTYKHYFFKDKNGNYSFSSWYFTSPTNASIRFPLKTITNNYFKTPKFTNYKIEVTYNQPNKPLLQKNFGRLYRTRLKKALKEKKPEFAGKYIIAQWGCDEGKNKCTTGGVIDTSTGKATEFPFKYYAHNGSKEIIYKLNSSLIIFAGDFRFKDGGTKKNKVLFYEFKDGKFLFLKASEYNK